MKKDSGLLFFFLSEQVVTEPPKSQSNVHLNYSSETNQMTNDVQRDQSALPLEQAQTGGGPFHPPTTTSSPTEPSFFSFPVTKTPGRSMCKLVSKKGLNAVLHVNKTWSNSSLKHNIKHEFY